MFSPQWREDDATIVEDERAIELACQATGVYDKEYWYSDEIPDDVWGLIDKELADDVAARIESGDSWKEALDAVRSKP